MRGYWKSADYSVEVAVKTLSNQHGPDGRLKLLQEAAIMSQFRHPNVVKLYGVVCDEQQVHIGFFMLTLELVLLFISSEPVHACHRTPKERRPSSCSADNETRVRSISNFYCTSI